MKKLLRAIAESNKKLKKTSAVVPPTPVVPKAKSITKPTMTPITPEVGLNKAELDAQFDKLVAKHFGTTMTTNKSKTYTKPKSDCSHIKVTNYLKNCIFDEEKIQRLIYDILQFTPYPKYRLALLFCGNKYITKLNEKDRKKKGPTDILSYPMYSPDMEHNFALDSNFSDEVAQLLTNEHKILMEEEKYLGEMVLSQPYVLEYCKENNVSVNHHMALLLTHGVLHLLGYDHEDDEDHKVMKAKEEEILSALEKKMGPEWKNLNLLNQPLPKPTTKHVK